MITEYQNTKEKRREKMKEKRGGSQKRRREDQSQNLVGSHGREQQQVVVVSVWEEWEPAWGGSGSVSGEGDSFYDPGLLSALVY